MGLSPSALRGGYGPVVRQRYLETVSRCVSPVHLPGATPGATGMSGHCTAREPLRSAAGSRAHDGTGRAALPHPHLTSRPAP